MKKPAIEEEYRRYFKKASAMWAFGWFLLGVMIWAGFVIVDLLNGRHP